MNQTHTGDAGATIARNSTLIAPEGRWWAPLGRDERLWVLVTLIWALAMFAMMQLIWPRIGDQQTVIETFRVEPTAFQGLVTEFTETHQVEERAGMPVVAPPPGPVYLLAMRYQFRPILRLQQGETYELHMSSLDVQHGLSLQPDNVNFQVLPGYVTVLKITPKEVGDYVVVCNEYCGTGHHLMLGGIEVVQ